MTRRPFLLACALLVAMSACGSTLQPTAGQSARGGNGLVDSTAETNGFADDALDGVSAARSVDGSSPGVRGSGGTAATTRPVGNSPASKAAGPLKVGVIGADVTALFVIFGAGGNSDSIYDVFNRNLDYINKTGGIAGRKVEAVYETVDVAEDQNAAAQRACETFTTDNKVDFVMPTGMNDVFLSCMKQHGIPVFDTAVSANDRGSLDFPNWFGPNALPINRYTPALVTFGVEQGFLKRGDKLGVLREDCPWAARVYNQVIKPLATKYGVTTVEATTKCIENLVSDLGPITNQIQQATLRFNSEDATHVLMVARGEGFYIVQFQQAAAQQQYHPKYFFSSAGFPYNNTHPDSPLQFQKSDLPNMLGLGHLPYQDEGLAAKPADATQAAAQAKCKEIDPQTGTANAADDLQRATLTQGFYALCDLFFDVREIARVSGGRFDVGSLTSAYRSLIASRVSTMLTGGRHQLSGNRLEAAGYMQPVRFAGEHPVYFGSLRSVL